MKLLKRTKRKKTMTAPKDPRQGKGIFRGERLRRIRELKGKNLEQLASMVELDQGQLSRYENGKSDPSAENLYKIARALDVSVDYLLGLTDSIEGTPTLTPLNEDEAELMRAVRDGRFLDAIQQLLNEMREKTKQPPDEGA